MNRREFITLLGGAAVAWPVAARAQQADRKRRIGILMTIAANDPEAQARIVVFAQALQALGWTDGRNARIDVRWSTTRSAFVGRDPRRGHGGRGAFASIDPHHSNRVRFSSRPGWTRFCR
jgi:hypothetical protein